jgi:hypothetical protein
MNTCKTCKHWFKAKELNINCSEQPKQMEAGGICRSIKLMDDGMARHESSYYLPDMLIFPFEGGSDLWTGPDFGCIHHDNKQ